MRADVRNILIRETPSERDIDRMIRAGQEAVTALVTVDGSLGAEEIARRYMTHVYAAVVSGGVREP